MREQHDIEQLAEVEQMENNSRADQQSQRIQQLEQQLTQMEESKEQADRAVGIINGLQEKGVISFNEDGKCNIIGNAHEQEEDPEQE